MVMFDEEEGSNKESVANSNDEGRQWKVYHRNHLSHFRRTPTTATNDVRQVAQLMDSMVS